MQCRLKAWARWAVARGLTILGAPNFKDQKKLVPIPVAGYITQEETEKSVTAKECANRLKSMKTYLQEIRDKFNEYELKARNRCPDLDYSDVKTGTKAKYSLSLTR